MVEPSRDAEEALEVLSESSEIQEEVLIESAASGTESGRTICGSGSVRGPGERNFQSVELHQCPLGNGAIMHGGGGHDFKRPEHSIIDMAIVLFHDPSASMVVGSEVSDMFVEPSETFHEDAVRAFQQAIGAEVESVEDVVALREQEEVSDVVQARREIRDSLAPLFSHVETPHEVTPEAIEQVSQPQGFTNPGERFGNAISDIVVVLGSLFTFDLESSEANIAQIVVSEAASAIVLAFFLEAFGGRPTEMVSG